MTRELITLNLQEIVAGLRQGDFSSEQLTAAYLERIAARDPDLHAYLEVFSDVLEQARQADEGRRTGAGERPLLGVPLAIKDNILIQGRIASSASKLLANYRASYDATVIRKLKEAGAIFLGRTNMDEFAMGSSTENSAFGPTRHPLDSSRVPGGSSGGSAAAVAAGLAPAALGSDTGGSIRQPAALCGVVGLKPTYGRVSRSGLMAMASSLDQIGPLTKTVDDAALLFDVLRGPDPLDSTAQKISQEPSPKNRWTIGVPEKFLRAGLSSEALANFRQSLERLAKVGLEIKEIDLPNLESSLACYYIIMPAEASTNLARYDGVRYGAYAPGETLFADYAKTRGENFGTEVKRRIMLGTYVLSAGYYDAYYGEALRVRELITADLRAAFETVDLIALPTTPGVAWRQGEKTADPLAMYLADICTVPANLAGVPAISLPSGQDAQGLPFGFQLMAPHFREADLFAVGRLFEKL